MQIERQLGKGDALILTYVPETTASEKFSKTST